MRPFIYPFPGSKLSGKTLIVPIVSTANVSQLAADLLISSFSLQRLAIFNPEFLVPVVGGREDDEEGVTTPLELYGKAGSDLLVIQQRSPVLKSRKQDFVASLLDFIKSSGVGAVLFLSGVDLSNRTDSQMFTPTYQIQPSSCPSLAGSPLHDLNKLPIPVYTSPVLQASHSGTEDGAIPFIPGGGLTRRILRALPDGWPIPTASLLQFVLEGDNRADAKLFAAVVAKVVGQGSTEWRQPASWKQGLFGAPHDQTLYG
ncbi:Proteasome assembly chaperone 2 [Hypsizygus marmoreus]|uniref:Proteasome assembly chaperone 2 n=1 Tax=Hypsizygus marmoreus TaxID=39966 RepID=A0A369K2P8_HYPMA|nr:Proteasome assembly chaperone 2 [Hypsizygus marmoreus]